MSDHHSKKVKKQQQLVKNRHAQMVNQNAEAHARGRDLEIEREEELREGALASARIAEKTSAGKPVWSEKMQMVLNKNTRRRTMATDRWNRFAGTEGGGGRGR
ncbi:MAG: hypothetical protein V4735_04870 [Pseudomonadota bacterium]